MILKKFFDEKRVADSATLYVGKKVFKIMQSAEKCLESLMEYQI